MGKVVYGFCGPGGVQIAGAFLVHVGDEFYDLGCRTAVRRYVSCLKSYGNLVLGIFAVYHDIVAGHPFGLQAAGWQYEAHRLGYGYRLRFGFGIVRVDRVGIAGSKHRRRAYSGDGI